MPTKTLKIGVTGGIGSGKSLVCSIFQTFGIPVYNADSRAKYLMTENQNVIKSIRKIFGDKAYLDSGALNTEYLANFVFQNEDQLKILNGIVHPSVAIDFEQWFELQKLSPYVIKEAALLVESGSYTSLDHLITVIAPPELRIGRVLKRDPHRTRKDIANIISNQLDDQIKVSKSEFVVNNDGDTLLIPQVLKIHHSLIS